MSEDTPDRALVNAEMLYVRLLKYEIEKMIAWAGECLEKGDYGGYARASLRIQLAMESLEKDDNT